MDYSYKVDDNLKVDLSAFLDALEANQKGRKVPVSDEVIMQFGKALQWPAGIYLSFFSSITFFDAFLDRFSLHRSGVESISRVRPVDPRSLRLFFQSAVFRLSNLAADLVFCTRVGRSYF